MSSASPLAGTEGHCSVEAVVTQPRPALLLPDLQGSRGHGSELLSSLPSSCSALPSSPTFSLLPLLLPFSPLSLATLLSLLFLFSLLLFVLLYSRGWPGTRYEPRLALNLEQSFCSGFLGTGVPGICPHTGTFTQCCLGSYHVFTAPRALPRGFPSK